MTSNFEPTPDRSRETPVESSDPLGNDAFGDKSSDGFSDDAPSQGSTPHLQIVQAARSLESALPLILDDADQRRLSSIVASATERGHFTPNEDEWLRQSFRNYLTARAIVLTTIEELWPQATRIDAASTPESLPAFTVAYAGACLLVNAGRIIVRQLAQHTAMRRKLDEPDPSRGIPRKQFTRLYRNLTGPRNAWRLRWARDYARSHRREIEALRQHQHLAASVEIIAENEAALDVSVRFYLWGWLRFWRYALKRRRLSALHKAMFGMLETSGRVISHLRLPGYRKRVNATVREKLRKLLQPGDFLVTRHHDAMSNLFLPGYWPHAALYIGSDEDRQRLGIEIDDSQQGRWQGDIRVLEALKDGVRFRTLDSTLQVDAITVLRPSLDVEQIRTGIARAVRHEGKLYDFAFDFFRADRIVCTEVIYRGFDGLGELKFNLTERAGRPTLSAEDILDMAVRQHGIDIKAIFGCPQSQRRVLYDEEARAALIASYRRTDSERP